MDITFWVIQAVLLTPVLFMAASVGMEDNSGRGRRGGRQSRVSGDVRAEQLPEPAAAPSMVAAAVAGLSQFTAEQQARLVILRSFVQESRSGGGALSDDLVAAPDMPDSTAHPKGNPGGGRRTWRPSYRQMMLIGGVLLMAIGVVGAVRTSAAMDNLQRNSLSPQEPLSPAARWLPGVIVNPAKYLSAVNGGGGGGGNARVDEFYLVSQMEQKQAMDRWEALFGVGLGLLLFANAMRASSSSEEQDTSVAVDVAPFVLVAAVLFAALSFFELP